MAYLKPQTPLKDLNSGDYFYPLTTIDQIITGTSRLSAFLNESNNLLNLSNIGNITGNIILNGTLTVSGNTTLNNSLTVSGNTIFDNSVDIKYNNFITFYGKNNNTSPMARMGYMSAISGGTVHCVNASNGYQASGAFYIWSNGCDTGNDNGGIAIDNEGVTVFGAGDAGDNFTGVFRVINEDDIASGPKFLVQKNGHTFIPAHLAVGGYNNTSYSLSTASFICNSWVRTVGTTGWYNESYGGGWFMQDSDWIRTYNNRSVYSGSGTIRSDNTVWGNKVRLADNWIGFYQNTAGGNRYGYIQADGSWLRIHKENGGNTIFSGSGNVFIRDGKSLYVGDDSTGGQIWCGTKNDTGHGEHQVGVQGGAGWLYMYCQAGSGGNKGLYGGNNGGSEASYIWINSSNEMGAGVKFYGAVWNDYAEFRKGKMDKMKPGQVVTETGNGTMILATQKLQHGCKFLSDTYGFALGKTKEYQLPIAVAGRALVYCDTPKGELQPGDCVCANYTGNCIKMTKEEIIQNPDAIIGTVSEIPSYKIWHAGDYENENGLKQDVVVDGRIWVYVR